MDGVQVECGTDGVDQILSVTTGTPLTILHAGRGHSCGTSNSMGGTERPLACAP